MGGDVAHIGVAGNVGTGLLIGGNNRSFLSHIVGNGSTNDGNGSGSFLGCDHSGRGVCHNEVNAVVNKLGHNGGAVGSLAAGQLNIKLDLVAQLLGQCILEALGSLVQSNVLHQLNDADIVNLFASFSLTGFSVGRCIGGAAGAEAQQHHCGHNQCKYAFHSVFSFSF